MPPIGFYYRPMLDPDRHPPVRDMFRSYLERTPVSFALWRTLEYQSLKNMDFRGPVLDLGCGDGLFTSILFPGEKPVGIDIGMSDLETAKSRDIYMGLMIADGRRLPFKSSSFNTVFSNCVIEHVENLDLLLQEAFRVLKPGGVFVVTVPGTKLTTNLYFYRLFSNLGLRGAAERYAGFVHRMLKHVNILPDGEWKESFQKAGFRIKEFERIVPAEAVKTFDLYNYSGVFAYISRILFNRWFVFPCIRRLWVPRLAAKLEFLLDDREDLGGGLVITGEKPAL